MIISVIAYYNSCLNPLIYTRFNHDFQKGVTSLFCKRASVDRPTFDDISELRRRRGSVPCVAQHSVTLKTSMDEVQLSEGRLRRVHSCSALIWKILWTMRFNFCFVNSVALWNACLWMRCHLCFTSRAHIRANFMFSIFVYSEHSKYKKIPFQGNNRNTSLRECILYKITGKFSEFGELFAEVSILFLVFRKSRIIQKVKNFLAFLRGLKDEKFLSQKWTIQNKLNKY